jgi:hypothetical protein
MDADSSLDHVFFPDSGVVSVVAVYADGSVIEMATIGREGCTGVKAVFGAKRSPASIRRSDRSWKSLQALNVAFGAHHVKSRRGTNSVAIRALRTFNTLSRCQVDFAA